MPDPDQTTVSASQAAALWNASPYFTRWMLWRHFARGMPLDRPPDSRMEWGNKMQPLIIEQAAHDLALECRPNAEYVRAGNLGATRDAVVICPDRGPGALETKCVFDYRTWMSEWDGGRNVPRHIEIQLQTQMLVGAGDGSTGWNWGVIAAWVAGEVHYFERKPIIELWARLITDSALFMRDVLTGTEPDPFGMPIEIEWLTALFPTVRGEVLDLTAGGEELAEVAVAFEEARARKTAGEREAEPLRARILAAARTAEEILLPSGIRVRITPSGRGKRITVFVPDTAGARAAAGPRDGPIEELLNAG